MTTQRKAEIAFAIALLVAIAFVFVNWLDARDAQTKAQAIVAAQQTVIVQAQEQMKQLQADDTAREQKLTQQLEDTQRQFSQAQSPQQIAALVGQIMGLKQPVTFTTSPPTIANPNPAPVAQVSTVDAPQIKAYVQSCQECLQKLPVVQAQVESLQSQLKISGQELSAQENETTAWKKAAKGTWWKNTKRAMKWFAIGAGAGVAAACATGHCK